MCIRDSKFYDENKAIMDMAINHNFTLNMENNTIDVPQMDNPRVSVLFMKFPTLNTRVILNFKSLAYISNTLKKCLTFFIHVDKPSDKLFQ